MVIDWVVEQTGKSLDELISLAGPENDRSLFNAKAENGAVRITLGPADAMELEEASIDCVVIDPPYYDNVTYSELSDFFYVWLKRTAGLLFPDEFSVLSHRQGSRGDRQPIPVPRSESKL